MQTCSRTAGGASGRLLCPVFFYWFFFFFSSRRRHTRCREVSWARRCVQETAFKIPEEEKLRIGIVGEIYVVMEPSVNGEIEKKLNYLGCETHRSQYLLEWVDYHIFPMKSKKQHELDIIAKGSDYIKINIGGHAQQTVGSMVDFYEKNYDGVIHLMPFSCLPELVSQSITNTLSKKIPIMTLSLDEQSGETNNQTRIEAFVDLLRTKKRKKIKTA
eukprot:TRINITY_DN2098_c0_g1_i2.p1 TRINITY_DN2098_c0_g1~~TRINITY_DN2098_c0_g1_i2.p1  ORF type:complete len:216 (-),score=47.32 TRINITY_DN2098_c0_g1_i2:90-737(-)